MNYHGDINAVAVIPFNLSHIREISLGSPSQQTGDLFVYPQLTTMILVAETPEEILASKSSETQEMDGILPEWCFQSLAISNPGFSKVSSGFTVVSLGSLFHMLLVQP